VVVVNPPQCRERHDQHNGGRTDTSTEQVARPAVFDVVADFPQLVQGENFHRAEPCVSLSAPAAVAGWTTAPMAPTVAAASAWVTTPARASARMTSTRSCRPASNCLPGRV